MNKSPPYKKVPVYAHSFRFAEEFGELPQYKASQEANIACKEAIEAAIQENYHDSRLNTSAAVFQVLRQFGYERTFYVLANTIREKDSDGRISRDNKSWAWTIPVLKEPNANRYFIVDKVSPGLVDLFTREVRHEHLMTKPLKVADVQAEAANILKSLQIPDQPNSPHGTHFMAQVSPDFMRRARTKDTDRLFALLPFDSLSLSTLDGREGVYALISKDEDRSQSLRQRRPSVRKQLDQQKGQFRPPTPGKSKVQER